MTAFFVPGNYAFDTYDELVAAINDWLDRSDLTGAAGQMVALAEARMRRLLTPHFDETTADIVCTDGVGNLPDDYSIARHVVYDGRVLPQYAQAIGNGVAAGSIPQAWSIEANRLKLWPATAATVTLLYQPTIAALSADTQTNEVLDKHPDLYFFGSMLFAEGYVSNDERAATFKNLFDEAIAEVREYLVKQRLGGHLVPRLSVP